MNHINKIVRNNVWTLVRFDACFNVSNTVENIIRDNVRSIATDVMWVNIGENVWHNHKLFKYNDLQQYKDNL
jgi:hypothetical protein